MDPEAYLTYALDIIQQKALWSERVDWAYVRQLAGLIGPQPIN
jgi:hypothetical protein